MPRIVKDYQEQARGRILGAGRTVFLRRGFRSATMEEIAQQVGVTKADLYHYFPSKGALLRQIGMDFPLSFLRAFERATKGSRSATDIASAIDRVLTDESLGVRRLWFDLMAESANDAATEVFMRRLNQQYLRAVTSVLRTFAARSPASNVLSIPDAKAVAVLFLIQGALVNLRMGTPRAKVRAGLKDGLGAILSR